MRTLFSLAIASALVCSATAAPKFNVLHIVSDDLNCSLGTYGHQQVKSPNIDKLAATGVKFSRAYCQFPLCNPSRASFMTGMRPGSTKVYENSTHFRQALPDISSIPQTFSKAGAFSARVGKLYHYGVPTQIGTSGLDDEPSWQLVVNPIGHDKKVEDKIFSLTPGQFGGTLSWFNDESEEPQTDAIGATEAIKLLEAKKGGPFYLAVGFYRPHTPYVAPKKYFDMYPIEKVELPGGPMKDAPGIPEAAYGSYKKEQDQLTDDLRRQALQAYFASTTFMDDQVGELLAAVDKLGLAANTVIVFHSDHGYHLGDHGLWQKMSLWENSAHVPLVIRVPGNPNNGKACPRTVELIDLHPTLADVCGLPAPKTDGVSLKPLLDNPDAKWDRPAFTQTTRNLAVGTFAKGEGKKSKGKGKGKGFGGVSVRTEKFRYTEWDEGRQGATLFDMETDPQEAKDLSKDAAFAEIVAKLKAQLAELKK
ncbi:MAG: sulfatase [Verrucomicrobiaceae bacterium]|nr:sulfatase [Verrucomicrobiaceae bacterium]